MRVKSRWAIGAGLAVAMAGRASMAWAQRIGTRARRQRDLQGSSIQFSFQNRPRLHQDGRSAAHRLIWPIAFLWAGMAGVLTARPLDDRDCARLLDADQPAASLLQAAARSLEAPALRGPSARGPRLAAEAILESGIETAGADANGTWVRRLCAFLEVEPVSAKALLTGYYQPVVPARSALDGEFRVPLYALPPTFLGTGDEAGRFAGALREDVEIYRVRPK